jgi:hypothetical protein
MLIGKSKSFSGTLDHGARLSISKACLWDGGGANTNHNCYSNDGGSELHVEEMSGLRCYEGVSPLGSEETVFVCV